MNDLPAKQLIQHWREGGVLSSNNIYTLVGEYEDLERKFKEASEFTNKWINKYDETAMKLRVARSALELIPEIIRKEGALTQAGVVALKALKEIGDD